MGRDNAAQLKIPVSGKPLPIPPEIALVYRSSALTGAFSPRLKNLPSVNTWSSSIPRTLPIPFVARSGMAKRAELKPHDACFANPYARSAPSLTTSGAAAFNGSCSVGAPSARPTTSPVVMSTISPRAFWITAIIASTLEAGVGRTV